MKPLFDPFNRGLNKPACLTIRENPCCARAVIENHSDDVRRGILALNVGGGIAYFRRITMT